MVGTMVRVPPVWGGDEVECCCPGSSCWQRFRRRLTALVLGARAQHALYVDNVLEVIARECDLHCNCTFPAKCFLVVPAALRQSVRLYFKDAPLVRQPWDTNLGCPDMSVANSTLCLDLHAVGNIAVGNIRPIPSHKNATCTQPR